MASKKTVFSLMLISLISFVAVGCSDDDNPVTAAAPDTAPPAAPVNFDGDYLGAFDAVLLQWSENTVDSDLAGYVLNREHNSQTIDLISEPALVQSYQDGDAPEGQNTYRVFAVDFAGNESAIATIQVTVGVDRAEPDLRSN